ncbi:MAG TPA: hypothetical protein VGM39_08530 [Kofleriaceae bacterium]|jgi:hypothetical protein
MAPTLHPLPQIATLYTIAVDSGRARCQPWRYDSKVDELSWSSLLTGEAQRMTLTNVLVFTDERTLPDRSTVSMSCAAMDLDIRDGVDALSVDGTKLFFTAAACGVALAKHEKVAFVPDCVASNATPLQSADTEKRFETLLAQGGVMYAHISDDDGAERCERYRFKSKPLAIPLPDVSGTAMFSEIHDMKTVRRVLSYRYTPGMKHPRLWLDDEDHSLEFADAEVTALQPMFFTMRACSADVDDARATRSWQPD